MAADNDTWRRTASGASRLIHSTPLIEDKYMKTLSSDHNILRRDICSFIIRETRSIQPFPFRPLNSNLIPLNGESQKRKRQLSRLGESVIFLDSIVSTLGYKVLHLCNISLTE